jgi:hypothetical protein
MKKFSLLASRTAIALASAKRVSGESSAPRVRLLPLGRLDSSLSRFC